MGFDGILGASELLDWFGYQSFFVIKAIKGYCKK